MESDEHSDNMVGIKQFLETLNADGGWGINEAMELGISIALDKIQNEGLSQIIIIADAVPHTPE